MRRCARLAAIVVAGMMLTAAAGAASLAGVDPDVAFRLKALDCSNLTAADVAKTLSQVPAPRIIALQGSVPIVDMEPFAAFLEKMGYPPAMLSRPGSDSRSYSSHVDSRRIVGQLAWHYERAGLVPILIGHSQGGMIVIKALHDLAGTRGREPIPVWNPVTQQEEPRTTITDPFTHQARDVNTLIVDYAAVLATGSLPRLLLGQWGILPLLRDVPDSVRELTAFSIPWDPIAGTGAQPPPFHATGTARVRNVVLPSSYSHIGLPKVEHLATDARTREWIDRYRPGSDDPLPQDADTSNIVHAADIWFSVKRHWCEGAKRIAFAGR